MKGFFVLHRVTGRVRWKAIEIGRAVEAIELARLHLDKLSNLHVPHFKDLILTFMRQEPQGLLSGLKVIAICAIYDCQAIKRCVICFECENDLAHRRHQFYFANLIDVLLEVSDLFECVGLYFVERVVYLDEYAWICLAFNFNQVDRELLKNLASFCCFVSRVLFGS